MSFRQRIKRFTSSRLSNPDARVPAAGFTLIEIVVALAVIGLIMGISVGQMDRIFDLEMKKTTKKLSATIRYLYNKAAMDKMYIRLVMDFEEQSYWVEATSDPFVIAREDSPRPGQAREKKEEGGSEEGSEASAGEETPEGEIPKLKPPEPKFGPMDSFLLRPTKLPETVFFKDVYVEHHRGAIEGGKAQLYFFPNGYVERAVINLRNEDDDVNYSLSTNPISGKVKIEPEYRAIGGEGR